MREIAEKRLHGTMGKVRANPSRKDEARIGQKNSLTRMWGQTAASAGRTEGPRPMCLGAVCPSGAGGGADHANLQYLRHEPILERPAVKSPPMCMSR